jgi:hypothetical protein
MRFHIEPRDVPKQAVARRLGLTEAEFDARYDNLIARGFPVPDVDTDNFDMHAVDRWCDARHPHLFGGKSAVMQARDASTVAKDEGRRRPWLRSRFRTIRCGGTGAAFGSQRRACACSDFAACRVVPMGRTHGPSLGNGKTGGKRPGRARRPRRRW